MSDSVEVLIVDDHPLVREGLAARLLAQPDLHVCGEAADLDQALELLDAAKPALMIVDLALKSGHGLDLIKRTNRQHPDTKMLVVSAYDEFLFAERVLRAGAHGYVNKQEAQDKFIEAVRVVLRGEIYLSEAMTQRLVTRTISAKQRAAGVLGLTDRELQILEHIGRGKSTRAIADQLSLSIHTIETHREHIRKKLGLRNSAELVQRAVLWVLEGR